MRQAWCGLLLQSVPVYTVAWVQPPHSHLVYLTEPNDHCSHHLLRAHTLRYAHSLPAWPTHNTAYAENAAKLYEDCPRTYTSHFFILLTSGCIRWKRQVWWTGNMWGCLRMGGESKSHVWAVRTFFVIRRKFSCFFCLQLVSLKSAETSLREGFK